MAIVECVCGTTAVMACAKHGHSTGILLHPDQRDMSGDMDAGFGGTCKIIHFGVCRINS